MDLLRWILLRESTFCSVRLLKGLCTLFMNSSHLMPPDFFSFPPVLNFDARKASQSVVKQIKSKQNPWESRVKKKMCAFQFLSVLQLVRSHFSPSHFSVRVTSSCVSITPGPTMALSVHLAFQIDVLYSIVTSCLRTLSGPQLWIQSKSFSVLKECGHKLWV